jgi:hypothetical protein
VPPSVVAPGRDIPPAVDAVVLQALRWRPEERFPTAAALVAALAATMTNESTDEWTRRPRHLPLRQRWLFAAAHGLGVWTLLAGTTVAAVSLAALGVAGPRRAPRRVARRARARRLAARDVWRWSRAWTSPPDAAIAAPPVVIAGAQEERVDRASRRPSPRRPATRRTRRRWRPTARAAKHEADAVGSEAPIGGAGPTDGGSVGAASRLERAALAARFAAQRTRAIAKCGPQIGLADRRGIKTRVRVQVRPGGEVQARAQAPWLGTPVGDCLESVARSIDFAATDQGGGFTWTLKF